MSKRILPRNRIRATLAQPAKLIVFVTDSAGTREVELPDQRQTFCDQINRLSAQTGIVASLTPPAKAIA